MSDTIQDGQMVFIHFVLRDDQGQQVDASPEEPMGYVHGYGQIMAELEKALEGQKPGAEVAVEIPPDEGFGEHDPQNVIKASREQFEFQPEVGTVVRADAPGKPSHPFMIVSVTDDEVILDGNHPLAGRRLNFEVKVVSMRDATEEELQEARDLAN